ncbi:MAG: class I SAM-dependent methyltransferase [Acidimicrobiia bacterium]
MTTNTNINEVPNHHAHHAGFAGVTGLVAAIRMTIGREANAALAVDLARLDATDHVVDIGCGPGTAVRRAARAGARATGIDPAGVMLRVARVLGGGDGVTYLEGAAEALPLPDASATVAWTIASVHHWPDLDGGIAEVRRVLEPRGRFVAIERHVRPGATGLASHGWTDERAAAFATSCRAAGFAEVRTLQPEPGTGAALAVVAVKP